MGSKTLKSLYTLQFTIYFTLRFTSAWTDLTLRSTRRFFSHQLQRISTRCDLFGRHVAFRMATLNCVYLNHLVESRFNGEIDMSIFGSLAPIFGSQGSHRDHRTKSLLLILFQKVFDSKCLWSVRHSGPTDKLTLTIFHRILKACKQSVCFAGSIRLW